MEVRRKNQFLRFFILSLLFHLFLIIAFLFLAYLFKESLKYQPKRRSTPAKVSIPQPPPPLQSQAKPISIPPVQEMPTQEKTEMASPQGSDHIEQIDIHKPLAQTGPKSSQSMAKPKSEPKHEQEKQTTKQESIPDEPEQAPIATQAATKSFIQPSLTGNVPITSEQKTTRTKSSPKKKLTGLDLLKSYRETYQSEWKDSGDSESAAQDRYAQVDASLRGLRKASYDTRIDEVLVTAFRIYGEPIYIDRAIHKMISYAVTNDEEGTIVNVDLYEPSGYDPLDSYIVNIIKRQKLPPIPKHLQTKTYKTFKQAMVNVVPGRHKVLYH